MTRVPRPARGTRPPRAARRVGPRLVLALFGAARPTASLRRALALARALGGELHVLRVLPGRSRLQALLPQRQVLSAARAVQQTRHVSRSTRSWLRVTLGSVDAVEQLVIAQGEFVERAAAYAASIDARMIIVPPHPHRLGRTATALARAAQMPVLVAREHKGNPAILAATDLRTSGQPVLWKAAELGQRLGVRLIALHNSDPGAMAVAGLLPGPIAAGATTVSAGEWVGIHHHAVLHRERLEQLAAAAERLPVEADTLVGDEIGAARAILTQAGALDPDWVAVGTRHRSWLAELACRSVAVEVVERARPSVLIVPLDSITPELEAPERDTREPSEPAQAD